MIAEKVMGTEIVIVYPDTQPSEPGLVSRAIAALKKLNGIGAPIPQQMEIVLTAIVAYAAEIEERSDERHP